MFNRIILAAGFLVAFLTTALAQPVTCPTRPVGDISNACASTAFVHNSTSTNASVKLPVKAATTANITLSGAQTIDGVSVVAGDRVLVKNQTTASQNGIYVAAVGAWTRATDTDSTGDFVQGTQVFVNLGTVNGRISFAVTSSNTITIGSSSIEFLPLPLRERLIANRTLYISCVAGSDSNNGLTAAAPFKTRQKAWDTVQQTYDLAGLYVVTVQALETGCVNEAFAAQGHLTGAVSSSGSSGVIFQGCAGTAVGICTASPDATAISYSSTTGERVWQAIGGAQFTTQYFSGASTGGIGGGRVLEAYLNGTILFGNYVFNSVDDRAIDVTGAGSYIGAIGPWSLTACGLFHVVTENGANFGSGAQTVTLTGTPACSENFVQADLGGGQEWTGTTFVGSATGSRFAVIANGWINVGEAASPATFFPGDAAGLITGGCYNYGVGVHPTSCNIQMTGEAGSVLWGNADLAEKPTWTRTPQLGVQGTSIGTLKLWGGSTNATGVVLNPSTDPAAVDISWNFPSTQGTATYLLTQQGAGSDMTWTVPTVTLGSTALTLGSTVTTVAGLTSLTSTTLVGALTGNASTATALQTARNINGTSFDGTASITVTAAADTLTGGQVALARGGTNADLSATGGTSQVLQQASAGAAVTVGQLATTNLSDVASGTFTPTILYGVTDCNTTGTPCTFTTRTCAYNKVSRQVTIECYIVFTAVGTVGAAGDTVKITGLPYTSAATFYVPFHARVTNMGAAITDLTALVYPSDTIFGELDYMSGGTATALTRAGLTATSTFAITGTYLTP